MSAAVRGRLASEPAADRPHRTPPRRSWRPLAILSIVLLAWATVRLSPDLAGAFAADRWQQVDRVFGALLQPDLRVLGRALAAAAVPLSMGYLGTALAALLAVALAYRGSAIFQGDSLTGERAPAAVRAGRRLGRLAARGTALVTRAVPEVFWAMLLVSFFQLGTLPGMLALAVHSTGVLARVFVESLDALPLRTLEPVQAAGGTRPKTFLYAALPAVAPEWLAYTFYQLEYNVRAGVVLGIVGVGGLGFQFAFEFEFFRLHRAATYLLVMVALAVLLDRLSRRLGLARARIAE